MRTICNYWSRLLYHLKIYGDRRECLTTEAQRTRRITPSEISIILQMIRKPNSIIIIVLLFVQNNSWFTALFTNMRNLKFKSQLTIAFFAVVNQLNGPLRKQNFTLTGSKGHGLWFLIGGFRSVLWVSVFQGSLLVIVIMIDGREERNCEGASEL